MFYQLRSQKFPERVVNLTIGAWYKVLRLAEEFGWKPIGTMLSDWQESPPLAGYYLGVPVRLQPEEVLKTSHLVIFEDALSLADVLEQALYDYEPVRLPVSYYLFDEASIEPFLPPSIGSLAEVIQLARLGAFWVKKEQLY